MSQPVGYKVKTPPAKAFWQPVVCAECGEGYGTLVRATEKGDQPAVYMHNSCQEAKRLCQKKQR